MLLIRLLTCVHNFLRGNSERTLRIRFLCRHRRPLRARCHGTERCTGRCYRLFRGDQHCALRYAHLINNDEKCGSLQAQDQHWGLVTFMQLGGFSAPVPAPNLVSVMWASTRSYKGPAQQQQHQVRLPVV
jgi:hypothetical protein